MKIRNNYVWENMHPIILLFYFGWILAICMLCTQLFLLGIALVMGWYLLAGISGWKQVLRTQICYMLPVMAFIVLINAMFQHYGLTVLYILDSGNAITLEAILYGFVRALMVQTVVCWFAVFHAVVQSDQMLYLTGRMLPGLALALSMSLRLVPHFAMELKNIGKSAKQLGLEPQKGHPIRKIKLGIRNLSVLISQALENAVYTVKSMRNRGFGQTKRTSYTNYRFGKKEWMQLLFLVIGIAVTGYGFATKQCYASYNPKVIVRGTLWMYFAFACYGLFPVWVSLYEAFVKKKRKNKTNQIRKEEAWKLWKY